MVVWIIAYFHKIGFCRGIFSLLPIPLCVPILSDLLENIRIGTVAKGLGASILLEGGILSHAYYQLIRTGAKVQVRYSFEKRQQFEFNKLVRDKIPEKIEKNGEEAVTAELNKKLLSNRVYNFTNISITQHFIFCNNILFFNLSVVLK